MRLIDVDKLKPDAEYNAWEEKFTAYSVKQIEKAVVEVVHCKDCKWWTKQSHSIQGRCELGGFYPTGGWFCANGERIDNE